MKRILLLVITVTLVVFMVGTGFSAMFSDIETSEDNTVTAGTLDLKVAGDDDPGVDVFVRLSNYAPGDRDRKCWPLRNAGTIRGQPWFEVTNLVNEENVRYEPEIAAGDLSDDEGELGDQLVAQWLWERDGNSFLIWQAQPINRHANSSFGGPLTDYPHTLLPVLDAGEEVVLCLDLRFVKRSDNNVAQSDRVRFNIVFHLDQAE